jgi:hypothetical protein
MWPFRKKPRHEWEFTGKECWVELARSPNGYIREGAYYEQVCFETGEFRYKVPVTDAFKMHVLPRKRIRKLKTVFDTVQEEG